MFYIHKYKLKSYFEKYKFTNVDQFDLWQTLYEQALIDNKPQNVNITSAMSSWTKQKGHPVVNIKKINKTHISISQNRFVLDSTIPTQSLKE